MKKVNYFKIVVLAFIFYLFPPILTSSISLSEGDLITGPDGIKVYIINEHGYKRHILNPKIFGMYGHLKWSNIKEVDQKTLDSYKTSDLYRVANDYRIFSVTSEGKKCHLNMKAVEFIASGYSWDQIFIINEKEWNYYILDSDITYQSMPTPTMPSPTPTSETVCQDECSPLLATQYDVAHQKYRVCGNYDEDNCLEWSSSLVTCSKKNGTCVLEICTDGTLYNQCSTKKPKYCENGSLVDKCAVCGCPSERPCQNDGFCSKSPVCTEVINNGDPLNKIDVVFIGDKYSVEELNLFAENVNNYIDKEGIGWGLLSVEPFKSYQNRFNFYRIDKTYLFGCEKVGSEAGTCSYELIVDAAKDECPWADEVILLENFSAPEIEGAYAGPHYVVLQKGVLPQVFVHEFGHAFGDLADEYVMGTKAMPARLDRVNCDITGCPDWCSGKIDTSKPCYDLILRFDNLLSSGEIGLDSDWEDFFTREEIHQMMNCDIGIDCMPGTGCFWNCRGWGGYRPANMYDQLVSDGVRISCIMTGGMRKEEEFVFCPVCKKHLIEVIEEITGK